MRHTVIKLRLPMILGLLLPMTAWSQSFPPVSNFYASTFSGADKCVQIQNAIDAAATGGGFVYADFPPGSYTCAGGFTAVPGVRLQLYPGTRFIVGNSVIINEGAHLVGFSTQPVGIVGGSVIQAANDLDKDVVLVQHHLGPTTCPFWAEIGWIRIEANGTNQTAGNALTVSGLCDTVSIHDILIKSYRSSGLHFTGLLSDSSSVEDIAISGGIAGPAVYFDQTTSGVTLARVHVVSSVGPAVQCKAGSGGMEATFTGFTLEGGGVAGAGVPAILDDATFSDCHMHFLNFTASSIVGGKDFIQHANTGSSTSNPSIILDDVNLGNNPALYVNLFDDLKNSYTVPLKSVTASGRIRHWEYGQEPGTLTSALNLTPARVSLINGANENVSIHGGYPHSGASASNARITGPTASFSIGGIQTYWSSVGGYDGQLMFLHNATAQTMTLNNEDTRSTAQNRITTGTSGNVVIARGGSALLVYDGLTNRWSVYFVNFVM